MKAFFGRLLGVFLLCALLPFGVAAQDLDALLEQLAYAVDDVSDMDTKEQGFEGIYIDPQEFAAAFRSEESAQKMLSRLPLAPADAEYYATRRNAQTRLFERPSGSYAAVTLEDGFEATSFFFTRRYRDSEWECIGLFPMGNVTLEEDDAYGVWFSGEQKLHGTGVSGTQVYLYSPETRGVVLSYTPWYRDMPLSDRGMELIGSLRMDGEWIALKHYVRGEGLWAGEATVVAMFQSESDGSFRCIGSLITDEVDVIAMEHRSMDELKAMMGL